MGGQSSISYLSSNCVSELHFRQYRMYLTVANIKGGQRGQRVWGLDCVSKKHPSAPRCRSASGWRGCCWVVCMGLLSSLVGA